MLTRRHRNEWRLLLLLPIASLPMAITGICLSDPTPVPDAGVPTCPGDMILIPAAQVQLGGPLTINPARTVPVAGFCIDRTEVTEATYATCVTRGLCPRPTCQQGPTMPARCIDADAAKAACTFLGRRLPSWDEWEYAARGLDRRWYPWGSRPGSGPKYDLHPAGRTMMDVSPFSVLDMGGNVSEWTATISTSDAANVRHLVGGGSWRLGERPLYFPVPKDTAADDVGFRCAK